MGKITKLMLSEYAPQVGLSVNTIQAGLARAGVKVGRGKRYTLRQLHTAAVGDFKYERTRSERAKADLAEMEIKEKEQSLVQLEDARKMMVDGTHCWRVRVLELPNTMADKVNPADPEHARRQLTDWVDQSLASLATDMDKLDAKERSAIKAISRSQSGDTAKADAERH